MEKLPNWLRWIIFMPLSIAAFVVVRLLNQIQLYFGFDTMGLAYKIMSITVEGTIAVMAMLATVYYVVPNNKKTAVISVSIVYGSLCIIGATISLINNFSTPFWEVLLSAILTIGSCIYMCVNIAKETP